MHSNKHSKLSNHINRSQTTDKHFQLLHFHGYGTARRWWFFVTSCPSFTMSGSSIMYYISPPFSQSNKTNSHTILLGVNNFALEECVIWCVIDAKTSGNLCVNSAFVFLGKWQRQQRKTFCQYTSHTHCVRSLDWRIVSVIMSIASRRATASLRDDFSET